MGKRGLGKAAVEFNCILENSSEDILKKIPKSFKKFLKNIEEKDYEFEYDNKKSLNEQDVRPETRGLIALVYQEYLCDDNEKKEYKEYSNRVIKSHEIERKKLYGEPVDEEDKNVSNNASSFGGINPNTQLAISIKKDRWYNKLFRWMGVVE